ncbi:glycosyltransferase family 1 protein [Geodermatophilus aquaeductus]|uniref:Glycosyltransferase involved in cell wall bisynthesis n=1 Tax=Geodermatophilus aquaeductus TaxID=1564161 RepID=A0A521FSL7_9ACTN|nr:glycosyltransferase family 1 protein [Geodermatophilus aquaeductus]SMO98520.1 Glycosyltransferase involved in cell wall bisynthesis [Geodermatophilus aquaeductus]
MTALSWLMLATQVPASGTGGGIVRYTVEMARALEALPEVELSVLATASAQPFFTDLLGDPARVVTVPDLPVPARTALERSGAALVRGSRRFDVIHGTKHVLPRWGGARRVLTVHDMLQLERPRDFGVLKRTLLTRPYLASIRQADALVCVSRATQRSLERHVPDVVGRTAAVPLAMSTGLRTADAEPVDALRDREFALVVGDASPRKNLGLVIDLWSSVVAERPGAVLAVVGPPSWGPSELGRTSSEMVGGGAVRLLGHLTDAQLRWCYEQAGVVLCPSRLEGFGLPAIEARSFGAPLITSSDPALVEVSGDAAVHLPDDDPRSWTSAILAALRAGRRDEPPVSVRSWDEVARETVAAVERLTAG